MTRIRYAQLQAFRRAASGDLVPYVRNELQRMMPTRLAALEETAARLDLTEYASISRLAALILAFGPHFETREAWAKSSVAPRLARIEN